MFNITNKTFQYGAHQVTLETGLMARQADGAVVVTMGETVVLVTVCCNKPSNGVQSEAKGMVPLTVNYQEKTYAAGKIPGGFFKREGKQSEKETLTSRLIDRPIRPLFPEWFSEEVQLIATVISLEPNVDGELPAMIGASAALAISGLPIVATLAAARVGYRNGEFLLNPSNKDIETSQLDLMVAGTKKATLMVESEADQLSEQVMLDAVFFGHEQMQVVIDAIDSFAAEVAVVNSHKQKFNWQAPAGFAGLKQSIESSYGEKIKAAYAIKAKTDRQNELSKLRQEAVAQLVNEEYIESVVKTEFELLEKYIVREQVLNTKTRIDGRDLTTVRNIVPKISLLPKTHGSALFTRGETQALAVCTLGTERDAQVIDSLDGEYRETFMLHYNFPPFSVGECGFFGAPKRREIGHGRLAKRAIVPVLPGIDNFPYVIRVVSEVLESNGSSSMATVCGTSLALMDAGVPIKAPVAGIAMGLVKENDKFAVLSDILGDEDHLGDMDFKVAGTAHGVTALQMDIKIEGIDRNIMDIALTQAKQGRLHILGIMSEVINQARANISGNAPRIMTMQVKADKIKDIIGKGGATIRGIVEKTGVNIDIDDNGLVKISSTDEQAGLDAQKEIEMIVADAEIGKIYDGKVVKIVDFGAFVNFLPGKDGLVHISQLSDARVEKVEDVLAEGQEVRVKVLDVDRQGRIKLSIKDVGVADEQTPQSPEPSQEEQEQVG